MSSPTLTTPSPSPSSEAASEASKPSRRRLRATWRPWQTRIVIEHLPQLWGERSMEPEHEATVRRVLELLNNGLGPTMSRAQLRGKVRRIRKEGKGQRDRAEGGGVSGREVEVAGVEVGLGKRRRVAKPSMTPEREEVGEGVQDGDGEDDEDDEDEEDDVPPPSSLRKQLRLLKTQLHTNTASHRRLLAEVVQLQARNEVLAARVMSLIGERNAARNELAESWAERAGMLDGETLRRSRALNLEGAGREELVDLVVLMTAERDAARKHLEAVIAERNGAVRVAAAEAGGMGKEGCGGGHSVG